MYGILIFGVKKHTFANLTTGANILVVVKDEVNGG